MTRLGHLPLQRLCAGVATVAVGAALGVVLPAHTVRAVRPDGQPPPGHVWSELCLFMPEGGGTISGQLDVDTGWDSCRVIKARPEGPIAFQVILAPDVASAANQYAVEAADAGGGSAGVGDESYIVGSGTDVTIFGRVGYFLFEVESDDFYSETGAYAVTEEHVRRDAQELAANLAVGFPDLDAGGGSVPPSGDTGSSAPVAPGGDTYYPPSGDSGDSDDGVPVGPIAIGVAGAGVAGVAVLRARARGPKVKRRNCWKRAGELERAVSEATDAYDKISKRWGDARAEYEQHFRALDETPRRLQELVQRSAEQLRRASENIELGDYSQESLNVAEDAAYAYLLTSIPYQWMLEHNAAAYAAHLAHTEAVAAIGSGFSPAHAAGFAELAATFRARAQAAAAALEKWREFDVVMKSADVVVGGSSAAFRRGSWSGVEGWQALHDQLDASHRSLAKMMERLTKEWRSEVAAARDAGAEVDRLTKEIEAAQERYARAEKEHLSQVDVCRGLDAAAGAKGP